MTWIKQLNTILDTAAYISWHWFATGAICIVTLGAIATGIAVVTVGMTGETRQMSKKQANTAAVLFCLTLGLTLGWLIVIAGEFIPVG